MSVPETRSQAALPLDDCWVTLEQLATACRVEVSWLSLRLDEGYFPEARALSGTWRFPRACLVRARRMREIEVRFEAVPELAALTADLLDELDRLRAQLRQSPGR